MTGVFHTDPMLGNISSDLSYAPRVLGLGVLLTGAFHTDPMLGSISSDLSYCPRVPSTRSSPVLVLGPGALLSTFRKVQGDELLLFTVARH